MELNENEIKKYLSGSLGKDLVLYETIDSTNNAAKLLAKNGAPHGSVVLSRRTRRTSASATGYLPG